jgi:hypothetical protein
VTLGLPAAVKLQELFQDQTQVAGSRDKRSSQPDRHWYDLKYRPPQPSWADLAFTVDAQFALRSVPGTVALGASADVQPAGVGAGAKPSDYGLKFRAGLGTDPFTLKYTIATYVFASGELSPRDDLRRVQTLRRSLEADPGFLVSLDGTADQRPHLFVQLYPADAAAGGPLGTAAVVRIFDAADVLAAFFAAPA